MPLVPAAHSGSSRYKAVGRLAVWYPIDRLDGAGIRCFVRHSKWRHVYLPLNRNYKPIGRTSHEYVDCKGCRKRSFSRNRWQRFKASGGTKALPLSRGQPPRVRLGLGSRRAVKPGRRAGRSLTGCPRPAGSQCRCNIRRARWLLRRSSDSSPSREQPRSATHADHRWMIDRDRASADTSVGGSSATGDRLRCFSRSRKARS